MDTKHDLDTFVILGSTPEEPGMAPIEVYLRREGAEAYLLQGLMKSFHVAITEDKLEPGGTISLIVTRGDPAQDPDAMTSGSFVVNNPNDRRAWDFVVIPHKSTPVL